MSDMFEQVREYLGRALRFRKKKKEPPPRRPIIQTMEELLASEEAVERLLQCMKQNLPGTTFRWDKILKAVNFNQEPTEEIPDPLRVQISSETLRMILKDMYDKKTSIASDGLALAREYIPLMYDKHSVERAKKVSQREREEKAMSNECFAYGELDHEIFASMYLRCVTVYGESPEGVFYDLGCGVGSLVYTAGFIGDFNRVIGCDALTCMLERGEKRAQRFERYQDSYTEKIRNIIFDWIEDDFTLNGFYTDGTFILLHWTALSDAQQRAVGGMLAGCQEGTFVLSLTNPVPGNDFEVLVHDTCATSWGKADWYFQEKVTPAQARRA